MLVLDGSGLELHTQLREHLMIAALTQIGPFLRTATLKVPARASLPEATVCITPHLRKLLCVKACGHRCVGLVHVTSGKAH